MPRRSGLPPGRRPGPVRRRPGRRRDRSCRAGRADLLVPGDHHLLGYRTEHPWYGRYFLSLLAALDRQAAPRSLTLLDVGANVGGVSAAALSVRPGLRAVAVDPDPAVQRYLRHNLAPFAERARVVQARVGRAADGCLPPAALLAGLDGCEVVWRSGTRTADVQILADAWPAVDAGCAAIWFGLDPWESVATPAASASLIDRLARSGREIVVYDAFGHHLVDTRGDAAATVLGDLTRWLERQHDGVVAVPSLDVWAVRRDRWTPLVRDAVRGAVAIGPGPVLPPDRPRQEAR